MMKEAIDDIGRVDQKKPRPLNRTDMLIYPLIVCSIYIYIFSRAIF